MKPIIYAAGPISGLTWEEATTWRQELAAAMYPLGIEVASPLRYKQFLKGESSLADHYDAYALSTRKGIMTRDRYDATRCDLLFAYLLNAKKVSIGTVMEIAWADLKRTPIVLVMEEGKPLCDQIHSAWLAALIDGEGCISIVERKSSNSKNYQLRINVGMTSEAMVRQAQLVTGLGTIRKVEPREERRRTQWHWQVVGQEAAQIVQTVFPYLIIKKSQAAAGWRIMQLAMKPESNAPRSGQQGFQRKSADVLAEQELLYQAWKESQTDKIPRIFDMIPQLGSPHDHAMIEQAAGYIVPTLRDGIEIAKAILALPAPEVVGAHGNGRIRKFVDEVQLAHVGANGE